MLAQVVKSRKSAGAVAFEGPFTSMFPIKSAEVQVEGTDCIPDMPSKMLTSGEAESARRVVTAVELL